MQVAALSATVSQPSETARQLRVVCRDHASVPKSTQVLRRVETEAARLTPAPDRTLSERGAVRLAGVLDDHDAFLVGDLQERRHITRIAVEMYWKKCLGARVDLLRDGLRRQRQGFTVHVGEDRSRSGSTDRERGKRRGHRGGDHLVPRTNAQRPKRKCEGIGSGSDADGMGRTRYGRELSLEGFDLGTQNEPAALYHPRHRVPDLRGHALVLGGEVDEGYGLVSHLRVQARINAHSWRRGARLARREK